MLPGSMLDMAGKGWQGCLLILVGKERARPQGLRLLALPPVLQVLATLTTLFLSLVYWLI